MPFEIKNLSGILRVSLAVLSRKLCMVILTGQVKHLTGQRHLAIQVTMLLLVISMQVNHINMQTSHQTYKHHIKHASKSCSTSDHERNSISFQT